MDKVATYIFLRVMAMDMPSSVRTIAQVRTRSAVHQTQRAPTDSDEPECGHEHEFDPIA